MPKHAAATAAQSDLAAQAQHHIQVQPHAMHATATAAQKALAEQMPAQAGHHRWVQLHTATGRIRNCAKYVG